MTNFLPFVRILLVGIGPGLFVGVCAVYEVFAELYLFRFSNRNDQKRKKKLDLIPSVCVWIDCNCRICVATVNFWTPTTYHRLLANSILWTISSLAVPAANLSNAVAVNSIRIATYLIHCWESFVDSTGMREKEQNGINKQEILRMEKRIKIEIFSIVLCSARRDLIYVTENSSI